MNDTLTMTQSIIELQEKFRRQELSVAEHTARVLDEAQRVDKELNYFTFITRDLAMERAKAVDDAIRKDKAHAKGKLLGVPLSVKDAICIKGIPTTGSSRILEGYRPPFSATAIERALAEGAIPIGHTVQDEFGFGAFSVNVGLGHRIPKNPIDPERSTGGSSGGCAGYAKKTAFAHASLGESTGGSIVEPAAFCGVAGLCPTYGRVSRYGLLDYASSMDKIGPIAKTVREAALVLEAIAGHDTNESTTSDLHVDAYSASADGNVKGMHFAVIKEAFGEGVEPAVERSVWAGIKALESLGATYDEISLPIPIKYGVPTYYLIGTSEASTNLAKYCGMRYGKEEKLEEGFREHFTKVRSMHLGEEVKRRIMLGTFARMAGYRDAYYLKALKVRSLLVQEYKKALKKHDVLVSPTAPMVAPKFSEIKKLTPLQHYMADIMTVGPNVAGLPHLSVPSPSKEKTPVGMLLIADHFAEKAIVRAGSGVETAGGAR